MEPADDPEIVLPCASVMVIIVLLNDAFTCATPETMFLRSRRRTRVASLAIVLILRTRPSCQALGMVDRQPRTTRGARSERCAGRPPSAARDPGAASCAVRGGPRACRPRNYFFLPAIGFALPLRVRAFV